MESYGTVSDNGTQPKNGRRPVDVRVMRGVLRAELPSGVASDALADRLAQAWAGVVVELGGTAEVVRVADALDPRWRRPQRPPPNRATPGGSQA